MEKKIENRLKAEVRARGGVAEKLLPGVHGGATDRLVLMPHQYAYFVEMKDEGKDIKKIGLQNTFRKLVEGLGFPWFRVNSEETLRVFVDRIVNDQKRYK